MGDFQTIRACTCKYHKEGMATLTPVTPIIRTTTNGGTLIGMKGPQEDGEGCGGDASIFLLKAVIAPSIPFEGFTSGLAPFGVGQTSMPMKCSRCPPATGDFWFMSTYASLWTPCPFDTTHGRPSP